MSAFLGGSAYAMVRDIAEGYHAVTERTFRNFARSQLDQLVFEFEKQLRGIRGTQPPLEDLAALQLRNRKIQRMTSACGILQTYRQKNRK